MAFVFLSYTHRDANSARDIETALQERGHQVWRDDTQLKVGTPIPEGVATGISLCDYFAVLLSTNAISSDWMRGELTLFASDPRRWNRILPLKLDGSR